MHRKYIAGSSTNVPDDSSDKQIRFALQQSNRAIQEILNKPTKRNNTDRITMMTACILFDCLACLQGHQAQALEHLRSGIKLLREVDDNMDDRGEPAIAHAVSLNSLRAVFVNLDVQARSIMSDVDHANWEPQPKHDYDVNIISFSSLKDARHYFEATINDVLAFLQDLEVHPPGIEGMDTVDRTFSRLRYQFESGSRMLDEFLGRASPRIDVQRDQSFIALRLLHAQLELLVKTFDEWEGVRVLNWHIEEQHFHTMMDLITQLMESKTESLDNSPIPGGSARPGQPLERPVFSSGFGLLAGLWMVSIRAPNVSLRWKAIGYLLDYPRREGFWDGTVAGRIAWEVMTLEETATMEELGILRADLPFAVRKAADIPDYLRIRDIAIKYTGLRGATVEFRNTRHVERKESGWARNMTW
ncbi:hypothetical protein K469DRAFT_716362 [Zopfia rhizophila CBS 207.26]|uniref:Uncharacterized protein n=1 Tax=Zopfia rhizophila CBS 207.26 TaxID=1314779 RepID=A0A6A6DLQ1_9PEZI|nr:hypothetical protein K469DRAFT_716362 [Zopfia rhizophila CBS 207.26]